MKLSGCHGGSELLSLPSLIFHNFKMHTIMLPDLYYYQHYIFLGQPKCSAWHTLRAQQKLFVMH